MTEPTKSIAVIEIKDTEGVEQVIKWLKERGLNAYVQEGKLIILEGRLENE